MNIPTLVEHSAVTLFNKEKGNDINVIYDKFIEEIKELDEAFKNNLYSPSPERLQHVLDELSDVQGVFTHLASIYGLYQREMLNNCIDKVKGRKVDPNYKRYPTGKQMYEVGKADNSMPINKTAPPTIANSLTAKRTSFKATGHPLCVPASYKEDLGWIMPDPWFYGKNERIIQAWEDYNLNKPVKMIKCNEQGIPIETSEWADAIEMDGIRILATPAPPEFYKSKED